MLPTKPTKEIFTDKFFVYWGSETIDSLVENVEYLGLNKAHGYYIKFNSSFYAVFTDSLTRQIIIGRDKVFYKQNNRLIETTIGEAKIAYKVLGRDVREYTPTLAAELLFLDSDLEVYEYPNVKSKEYRIVNNPSIKMSNYVVLLGVTFSSRFYTVYEDKEMRKYFKHTDDIMSFLKRTKGAICIDPFTQNIKFQDGSIGAYSFQMSIQRNNSYRYGGYDPSPVLALQEKNIYSPFRKREWTSMTRYKALYPDDDLDYSVTDLRVEQNTCKWCGGILPKLKKSYCCENCRMEYIKTINLERGALLPYYILCRDNFICQECGMNMALINEYGMRLPISRLSSIPDKDGKYRSEAEVDHITPVEDGGIDHQTNLHTLCQCCHKTKHKKRLSKNKENSNIITIDFTNKSNSR